MEISFAREGGDFSEGTEFLGGWNNLVLHVKGESFIFQLECLISLLLSLF